MALNALRIDAQQVSRSPRTRLDVRYHSSAELISRYLNGVRRTSQPLAVITTDARNGENIPAASYADGLEDAGALYLSVGALSQFALRMESLTPLLTSGDQITNAPARFKVSELRLSDKEVLLTRSGTPGIAWPGRLAPAGLPIIPSGFLIRLRINDFDTVALAALLNHPVWRLHSLALSAGKRQDNISQPNLQDIPIPALDPRAQRQIAEIYLNNLMDIETLSMEDRLSAVCDAIIAEATNLPTVQLGGSEIATRNVRLRDVAHSPATRADNRWHGVTNQHVLRELEKVPTLPLEAVISALPAKGRQPTYLEEADGDNAYAIATSTLQMGQIVLENAKPVPLASVTPAAAVEPGQLLVAMDGDGSLGKAAVVPDTSLTLMRDSHIALVKTDRDPHLPHALACWLNSTWGQVQTNGLMSGATGQTGLRATDLISIRVPRAIVDHAEMVAGRYIAALNYVDTPPRRARRILCGGAALVSEVILANGAIDLPTTVADEFTDADRLWELLTVAYPTAR